MNANTIKSFSVYGLFGTNDVHIPFDENIKILIGENGLGKTQVLNLFYYTLTRNFFRLSEFNFDKLVLEFSISKIEITKSQIDDLTQEIFKHPTVRQFIDEFGFSQFEMLRNKFMNSKGNRRKLEMEIEFNARFRKFPINRLFRVFDELESNPKSIFDNHLSSCEREISECIKGTEIMYFPTFRRVEEDLHSLGYDEEDLHLNEENTLIKFGMDDVRKQFDNIANTIDQLLKKGLSNFTKDILQIVISNNTEIDTSIFDKINGEDLEIIFARAGNELQQQLKDAVKEMVKEKKLNNSISGFLLQKLVELYEMQKTYDNSVKIFRDVCNKYLINKKVFYDESAIKIYVKSNVTGDEIKLSKLSSGEKQIISIFSKIYLSEADKRFIVLFDEPELSLSILWQKQLLPDIINSQKCDFLLAVTHSPFIFDNMLDEYAVGLNEYIKTSEQLTSESQNSLLFLL